MHGRRQCTKACLLCFSEFVFEIGQDGPLSASHYNIVHLQKGVSVGIIPKGDYRMGDRLSVAGLQWLAYTARTRNNISYAGNESEVRLPGVPNVKVDGYCEETNEVFEYLGCFRHG